MTNSARQGSLETTAGPSAARQRLLTRLAGVARILVFSIALWFLYRQFAEVSFAAVLGQLKSVPVLALTISIALAVCHYSVSTAHDAVALRYLNSAIPYRRSALISFLALAVGRNLGVATLTGASIRQRLYSELGLSASQITTLHFFLLLTAMLGGAAMAGLAMLVVWSGQGAAEGAPLNSLAPVGVVLLAPPLLYLAIALARRAPVKIASWEMSVPSPKVALGQLGLACFSHLFAAATLYILLVAVSDVGFASFLPAYLLAMAAGLASRIPGSLGVFEAFLFVTLPEVPPDALLSGIIVYRCIHYLAPLVIAMTMILQRPGRQHQQAMRQPAGLAVNTMSNVMPQVIGTLVFLAGLVILVTVAYPPDVFYRQFIANFLPLSVLELSYFLGGVVGAALLLLARGLFSRLHAAYLGALAALLTGVVVSLLLGRVYLEANFLGIVMIALFISRREFYRQDSLAQERFPTRWLTSLAFGIGLAIWVSLVSHRQVGYANELWLQFAVDAEPARSLRAIAAAVMMVVGGLGWSLLSRRRTASLPSTVPGDTKNVLPVIVESSRVTANLALLGDKRLHWSDDGRAFLMYQVSGDSWVACGDPLGPQSHQEELVRSFRDMVIRHYGRPLFYQVSEELLPLYVDLGLAVTKVGEEARVRLSKFSLQDSRNAELFKTVSQIKQHGFEFDVVPRAEVPSIMEDLRQVSRRWIADKYAAEKRFSVGSFSESYIENFDCAVVRIDGTLVAFANLWPAPAGKELAIDLLRYSQMAPQGIMDYLFAEAMSWGREGGYTWFNLGMAPLAASEQRPLASLQQKLDNVICGHSDNFYDLVGLRTYKDKFKPMWRPRYLASPPGLWELPNALLDTSRMISGGVAGMFATGQGG